MQRRYIDALTICNACLTALKPKNDKYPKALKTLGDHLRKVRLDKNLHQSEVAKILNVNEESIRGWELNRNNPTPKFAKKIIQFIGYIPSDWRYKSFGEKIKYARWVMGINQRELAEMLNCDCSHLHIVELNKRIPEKTIKEKLLEFIASISTEIIFSCATNGQ